MNNDPEVSPLIGAAGQAFPSWPVPSGGAPVTVWELGPGSKAPAYGSAQQSTINIAPPIPVHPYSSTFFPKKMATGANGQNQKQNLPPLPTGRDCVLPDKASPSISQIQPPPIMGPGSSQPHLMASQVGRLGTVGRSFPAGSYLDGMGTVITPTRVVGGLGN